MMHLTSVLLPAPFSPRRAWKVPGGRVRETSSRTTREPKLFLMPRAASLGGVGRGAPRGPRRAAAGFGGGGGGGGGGAQRATVSSAGWPGRRRLAELVAIMIPRVRT